MCGIAGMLGNLQNSKVEQMLRSLCHRGPDETGLFRSDGVTLGISRLAIIDVANGHQPVFTSDESSVAVFNGEIYNHRELAKRLRDRGVLLNSEGDGEVIPHLYAEYGLDFVRHLRGMFAIALWDGRRRRLVLARDRVGKKPLFYARRDGGLLFASEVRALLAAGWSAEVDLQSIDHLLAFGYLPVQSGVYKSLYAVPPGNIAVWENGTLDVQPYWSWRPTGLSIEMADLESRVESVLDEAVRLRLVAERPLGAFLSGGIDSTIVTALMARHHTGPVKTFSIGFSNADFDESSHARDIATYLGTEHTELIVEPDPLNMLNRVAEAFDQPFADSSAIPTLLLSELAAQGVVVALSGDGGDEAFGGYDRYLAAPWLQKLNPLFVALNPGNESLLRWADRGGHRKFSRIAREMRTQPDLGTRYRGLMEYVPLGVRERLWTKSAQSHFAIGLAEQEFDETWNQFHRLNDLNRMRAVDVATYLPGDLLTKVDISSMSCSLEVRSPFLDQEVLALATQLPREAMIRGRTTKWILREMAYRLVPRELIDRPKRGFGIPQAAWLRGPLREVTHDLLMDNTARQRGWFEPLVVEKILAAHDQGIDHDRYIWPLLMIEVWARRWLDSK